MVVCVDIGTYTRGYKWFQYQVLEPGSSIDPYSLKTFNFQCFHTKLGKFKSCLIWAEEGSRLSSVLSDGNDVKANNCKFKICIYPSIENHWNNFAKFLNFKIVRTLCLSFYSHCRKPPGFRRISWILFLRLIIRQRASCNSCCHTGPPASLQFCLELE